jgi:hypothetical protein
MLYVELELELTDEQNNLNLFVARWSRVLTCCVRPFDRDLRVRAFAFAFFQGLPKSSPIYELRLTHVEKLLLL